MKGIFKHSYWVQCDAFIQPFNCSIHWCFIPFIWNPWGHFISQGCPNVWFHGWNHFNVLNRSNLQFQKELRLFFFPFKLHNKERDNKSWYEKEWWDSITKRRPQVVSKDAPNLFVASHSGRDWTESLATAANPYSCKPSKCWSPPIFDIVFDDGPSKLIFKWLNSKCDFSREEQIFNVTINKTISIKKSNLHVIIETLRWNEHNLFLDYTVKYNWCFYTRRNESWKS